MQWSMALTDCSQCFLNLEEVAGSNFQTPSEDSESLVSAVSFRQFEGKLRSDAGYREHNDLLTLILHLQTVQRRMKKR